jgi:hypothetical protein
MYARYVMYGAEQGVADAKWVIYGKNVIYEGFGP